MLTYLFLMCHFCLQTSNQKCKMRINIRQMNFQSGMHFYFVLTYLFSQHQMLFCCNFKVDSIPQNLTIYALCWYTFLIAIDVFVISNCYNGTTKLLLSIFDIQSMFYTCWSQKKTIRIECKTKNRRIVKLEFFNFPYHLSMYNEMEAKLVNIYIHT